MNDFIPITTDKKRWWNRRQILSITIDEYEGKWSIQFDLKGGAHSAVKDFPSREAAERWLKPYVPVGVGK